MEPQTWGAAGATPVAPDDGEIPMDGFFIPGFYWLVRSCSMGCVYRKVLE
jgi:hypothetical protein